MSFLALRITAGCGILLALLIADLVRSGRRSQRLREYGFLLFCVVSAIAFCIAGDSVTSRISPEYFQFGKELARGPGAFEMQVALLAATVGWPAGLAIGATLLTANSIGAAASAPCRRLAVGLLPPTVLAVVFAALGGAAFVFDPFGDWNSLPSWPDSKKTSFLIVQGMHLGAYLGGGLGTAIAACLVYRERSCNDNANRQRLLRYVDA